MHRGAFSDINSTSLGYVHLRHGDDDEDDDEDDDDDEGGCVHLGQGDDDDDGWVLFNEHIAMLYFSVSSWATIFWW